MAHDLIGYQQRAHAAMIALVRGVLRDAARDGLPGAHHFYLTFRTNAEGVEMAAHLRESHGADMTIVLQNQFDDLAVEEDSFSVTLHFDGKPERLTIPFAALTGFIDPSVEFGLRFPEPEAAEDETEEETHDKDSWGEIIQLDAFRDK